jgi:hypothetical protein
MNHAFTVYVVKMTEYERGWGSRPDGYLAFRNEDAAVAYVDAKTKDRPHPAPDEYVDYEMVGYLGCSPQFLGRITKSNLPLMYFDHLNDLKMGASSS